MTKENEQVKILVQAIMRNHDLINGHYVRFFYVLTLNQLQQDRHLPKNKALINAISSTVISLRNSQ